MKDKDLKIEDVNSPHTLLIVLLYTDSTEEVVRLLKVDLQKPRNLNSHESEECEYGEGVDVYDTLLKSDTVYPYGLVKKEVRGLWGLI